MADPGHDATMLRWLSLALPGIAAFFLAGMVFDWLLAQLLRAPVPDNAGVGSIVGALLGVLAIKRAASRIDRARGIAPWQRRAFQRQWMAARYARAPQRPSSPEIDVDATLLGLRQGRTEVAIAGGACAAIACLASWGGAQPSGVAITTLAGAADMLLGMAAALFAPGMLRLLREVLRFHNEHR